MYPGPTDPIDSTQVVDMCSAERAPIVVDGETWVWTCLGDWMPVEAARWYWAAFNADTEWTAFRTLPPRYWTEVSAFFALCVMVCVVGVVVGCVVMSLRGSWSEQ